MPPTPMPPVAPDARLSSPAIVVLMGVSGAGKTTVGERLAGSLGWSFADADAFHSAENVARMHRGEALTDVERAPWLASLRDHLQATIARGGHLVLACSALRRIYREALTPADAPAGAVQFVHLRVSPEVLAQRLAARVGHYMPATLLGSQLATLEEPERDEDATAVDGERPVDDVVTQIRTVLGV